jgi:hypothetical protein
MSGFGGKADFNVTGRDFRGLTRSGQGVTDLAATHGHRTRAQFCYTELLILAQGRPMRRREFITLIGSATVTWPFASLAQEAGRSYRLGMLFNFPREYPLAVVLIDDLRRRGFIEGQNTTIDYRVYGQHPELISEYAAQLIKAEPNVLLVGGGAAVRIVQKATKSIPILGFQTIWWVRDWLTRCHDQTATQPASAS